MARIVVSQLPNMRIGILALLITVALVRMLFSLPLPGSYSQTQTANELDLPKLGVLEAHIALQAAVISLESDSLQTETATMAAESGNSAEKQPAETPAVLAKPPPVLVNFTAVRNLSAEHSQHKLDTFSQGTLSPYFENSSCLTYTPLIDKFPAIAHRLSSLDTGRLLTIPKEHFSLVQPPPSIYTFNPANAIAYALLDIKYMFECGPDAKRDIRFSDDCTVNNTMPKPEGYTSPKLQHNLTLAHDSLKSIIKAWSTFSRQHNFIWWMSHGEMLGWFWNGKLLPWDVDLDIQMSTFDLMQLVAFNQTLIDGRFLVDVSPNIFVRSPQELNTIDARLIDSQTGYLVDITGLSLLESSNSLENQTEPHKVTCKSPHTYLLSDILPLHETVLEGIAMWRPRAAISILSREYSEKALYQERYRHVMMNETFVWQNSSSVWESIGDVPLVEEAALSSSSPSAAQEDEDNL
ncbi:hypothetical protein HDU77_007115 [Chytriomyces hyalinus]|nr:hypothetical protein HDU77_007115 [Chytriomyces hyalinus]